MAAWRASHAQRLPAASSITSKAHLAHTHISITVPQPSLVQGADPPHQRNEL